MNHYSLFLLSKIKGLSGGVIWSLLKEYGQPENILASIGQQKLAARISELIARHLKDKIFLKQVEFEFHQLPPNYLTILDADYPLLLKNIYDPPLFLFYRGNKSLLHSKYLLTMVGSRTTTVYHQATTQKIISQFATTPLVLTSGLAIGIDTLVHQAALKNNLPTIAVLGSGFSPTVLYPQSNIKLAQSIVEQGGLILSEYPPDTPPALHQFPQRNRILAGLSAATVVISGADKSGTLITAQIALDENREVFALPGNINLRLCRGPNSLLNSGASVLTGSEDILKFYKLATEQNQVCLKLSLEEQAVINLLKIEPRKIEVLANILGLKLNLLQAIISQLEIKGLIKANLQNEVELS
ncbi:MAG: DNA-processing protein DprA [Patescibacteria group bacterium]